MTDPSLAMRYPELAVMSVMAHGKGDPKTALTIAQFAAAASLRLDRDKQALYLDLIEDAVGEAARKAFQVLPQHYQFKGPSYREGKTEGKAEGEAESIVVVLDARGVPLTDEQRRRILACDDIDLLGVWLRRAAVVPNAAALFES